MPNIQRSAKKGSAKKGAAKKGGAKGGAKAASAQAGVLTSASRLQIDRAAATIARSVETAIARQQLPGGRLRGPILVGIWIDPITKKVQVFNQLEQF